MRTARGLATPLLLLASLVCQADSFIYGADLSYVNEMEDCGAVYRENGQARDPFELFAEQSYVLSRLRLWHNPDWTDYSNLEDVRKSMRRSIDAGMSVLLDFHYSDDWADPGRQNIPAAWAHIDNTPDLAQALHDYTLATLRDLASDGLVPAWVQVGNETNTEIMRKPGDKGEQPINWKRNAALLNAGIRAVRAFSKEQEKDIRIMLHIAQPEFVIPWFDDAIEAGVTDFDLVGISYYNNWSEVPMSELVPLLKEIKDRYQRDFVIVENSYPFSLEWADDANNILTENSLVEGYPATPDGQLRYLRDLDAMIREAGGIGYVYWEPAWVSTACETRWGKGSHWENATFFDFRNGNEVLPAMGFMRQDPAD